MSANILPGMMIDIYWSESVRLLIIQVPTVLPTKEVRDLMTFVIASVIAPIYPPASIIPPNAHTHIINHTVLSIPAIPLVLASSVSIGLSVVTSIGIERILRGAITSVSDNVAPIGTICSMICGCAKTATTELRIADRNNVRNAGTFLYIIKMVAAGISSSHKEMLNVEAICALSAAISIFADEGTIKPATVNMIAQIISVGMFVMSIYLICLYKSTPEMLEDRYVVSESGEILSPKYAPDIIAPASHPLLNPIISPALSIAMPMVPIVVQELPRISEISVVNIKITNRNMDGFIRFNP